MLLAAIFLVSLSTLAFEVLLTRVFSIGQWNHLSFMVISIALFGFAASGSFLSILDNRKKGWIDHLSTRPFVAAIAILYTSTSLLAFFTLTRIPLDYFRLPLQPVQSVYLLLAYVLLALPFFFSGLIISVAYALIPEKTGLIYFASMAGSALGAIIPAALLPYLGEERLVVIATLLPLFIAFSCGTPIRKKKAAGSTNQNFMRLGLFLFSAVIFVLAMVLLTPGGFSFIRVHPSHYKALSQILQFPDTQIIEKTSDIRGRTERIKTPYVRFAPGLSLKYGEDLPPQHAVFRDGDNQFVIYDSESQKDMRFATFTLSFAGYYLMPEPENILLVENSGGLAIACAKASGARKIRIVVQNPQLARVIRKHYHLPVIDQNVRVYLTQSTDLFDIIHVEDWGASIPGADALNQHHLLTTSAISQYLNHLTPDGMILISRRLLLPPADSIRLWATAYESLKMLEIKHPQAHLAILRNWDTFTLIVSATPLKNLENLKKFAADLNFDIVFSPAGDAIAANRFNIFAEPYHFMEIEKLAEAYANHEEDRYFDAYLLDVVPQSDNRPFPGRFWKWSKLKAIYKSMGSRIYGLLMSGEIVVSVVFFEAMLISGMLLFVPPILILRGRRKPAIYQIVYFFGVGAGFMCVELFFIKRFILLFGDPVISFTVVLSGILVFSSLGGLWFQAKPPIHLRYALISLIAALVITAVTIDWIVRPMHALSTPWRYICSFLLLFPSGFLLGFPFPVGMRFLLKNPVQRSFAWSVNGCASVLASIGSAQIALSFGIPYIMAAAILAYICALLSVPKHRF